MTDTEKDAKAAEAARAKESADERKAATDARAAEEKAAAVQDKADEKATKAAEKASTPANRSARERQEIDKKGLDEKLRAQAAKYAVNTKNPDGTDVDRSIVEKAVYLAENPPV